MEYQIKVNQPLFSSARKLRLGKGARLDLSKATFPMIEFLREEFLKNQDCLCGDIRALFKIDTDINI